MKRKRVLAHLAIVALALVILGMARSQMPSDDPRAQQVRWDDPKLHNNPPFRQLKSRVERGQATERETRYFAWLLPRVYPFEKIPERAYKNARVQQDLFRESAVDPASLPSWAVTSTAWVPLGPRNIEGRVTAIALHPVDSGIIYAAGETGGIFKTADGGNTWMTATDELPDLIVQDIQFLPGNPDSLFAGAGTGHLYVSTDAGASWTTRAILPDARQVDRIRINPQDTNVMYAVQQDFFGGLGVYKSSDGGLSWTKSLGTDTTCPPACTWPPPAGFNDLAMDSLSPQVLYAVLNQDGVYRTLDGGDSWVRVNSAESGLPTQILDGSVAAVPSIAGSLYAAIQDPSGDKGLYVSFDYGTTWIKRSSPSHCCFGEIVVDPANPNAVYFSHFESLYKSLDGGVTLIPIPQTHVDQQSFAIQPGDSQVLWAGNDGGLDKSTNQGTTWTEIRRLPITQYYGLAVMPNNPSLILGVTQDNWINRYRGTDDWDQLYNCCGFGDLSAAVFDPGNSSIVYAQSVLTYVNKSIDGGDNWFWASTGLDNTGSVWKAPLAMFRQDPNVLYAGGSKVHATRDGGANWSEISPSLSGGGLSALGVSATDGARLYAGFSDGTLFRTDDGGSSWARITGPWPARYITALAVDPKNDRIAYVTLGGFESSHVWRTADSGSTWRDVGSSLPDVPYNDVVISPLRGDRVVVVNDIGGVFETKNDGHKWAPAGDLRTLPNTFVTGAALELGVDLTVATYGRGMWRLPSKQKR